MLHSNALSSRWRATLLATSSLIAACAEPPPAKIPSPSAAPEPGRTNWVCRGLVGHFLGLPSSADDPGGEAAPVTGC